MPFLQVGGVVWAVPRGCRGGAGWSQLRVLVVGMRCATVCPRPRSRPPPSLLDPQPCTPHRPSHTAPQVSLLLSAALWQGSDLYRTAFTAPQQFALRGELGAKVRGLRRARSAAAPAEQRTGMRPCCDEQRSIMGAAAAAARRASAALTPLAVCPALAMRRAASGTMAGRCLCSRPWAWCVRRSGSSRAAHAPGRRAALPLPCRGSFSSQGESQVLARRVGAKERSEPLSQRCRNAQAQAQYSVR
jgi:hypothetical protein